MSAGSKPRRAPSAKDRMQIRCSVDNDMADLFDWLEKMPAGKRGRELIAAARVGHALRVVGSSLASLTSLAAPSDIGTSKAAAPHGDPLLGPAGAPPAGAVGAPGQPAGASDLSMAAAESAASAFGADFFDAVPTLQ